MQTNFFKMLALAMLTVVFHSCTQTDDDMPTQEEVAWTQVTDLQIPDHISVPNEFRWEKLFLYSLEEGRPIPTKAEFYTENWDIGFQSGRLVHVNEKSNDYTIIEGAAPMVGKVFGVLLIANFDEVVLAPDPSENIYNKMMSTQGVVDTTRQYYGWNGNLGNIGYMEMHPNTGGKGRLLPQRTFVFRTNKGNYAKLEMQGIYKGHPAVPTRESEPNYLTFRYFVQKDGSRNLDTSKRTSSK
ncbi:HmuY family protein [Flavobacterium sp. JP2137]|uniref:HmuY family protein n=1 Tax=Flavobacterium sp. JP2137 TaxID=3414510 RepID=UPI003D2FCF7C